MIKESELILNDDGSIYHLNLLPGDVSDVIINVGDPERVNLVSGFFDHIEIKKQKREFVTHTGTFKGRRMSVISTGIGTDNIDIVYNELDALVNVDLQKREVKNNLTALKLVRIGTCGALQADISADSYVCSTHGLGLDGLLNFYRLKNNDNETQLLDAFQNHYPHYNLYAQSYIAEASQLLLEMLSPGMHRGITASCCGFYAPQGRVIRAQLARQGMIDRLSSFKYGQHRITNFEMETSAMFGLAKILGHHCASVNLVVANRITKTFSRDYKKGITEMIEIVLNRLSLLQ